MSGADWEKRWIYCLKVEATVKTGNRMCMHHRHDKVLLHFARLLGFKTLLADIRAYDFRFLDYFYRAYGGDYSVWLQRVREKERAELRAEETTDPRVSELVAGLAERMRA